MELVPTSYIEFKISIGGLSPSPLKPGALPNEVKKVNLQPNIKGHWNWDTGPEICNGWRGRTLGDLYWPRLKEGEDDHDGILDTLEILMNYTNSLILFDIKLKMVIIKKIKVIQVQLYSNLNKLDFCYCCPKCVRCSILLIRQLKY